MASLTRIYDVYISHAPSDGEVARRVADVCRDSGLEVAMYAQLLSGKRTSDRVWDALAESRALIALLSSQEITPTMGLEFGAAMARNKPLYGVVTGPSLVWTELAIKGIKLFTMERLADVINLIKVSVQQFTEEDSLILVRLYSEATATVDQLALDHRQLARLARDFGRVSGKQVDGDRLLSELLRLRKQKKLVRRRASNRATS